MIKSITFKDNSTIKVGEKNVKKILDVVNRFEVYYENGLITYYSKSDVLNAQLMEKTHPFSRTIING